MVGRTGQWSDDDYGVLENGVVLGRIFFLDAVGPRGRPGCGRAATAGTSSAPHTAMSPPARVQWPRSLEVGAVRREARIGGHFSLDYPGMVRCLVQLGLS